MVNDIIAELLDLNRKPTLDSLWWTRTCNVTTLKVVSRVKTWDTTSRTGSVS